MADITISRQDYGTNELNGWKPNTISGALSATAGTAWDIPAGADFKDHKTVFVVVNGQNAAVDVTIKAGDTYAGSKDVVMSAPVGTSLFWIDSSKFANKKTGKISITAASAVQIIGYEMR